MNRVGGSERAGSTLPTTVFAFGYQGREAHQLVRALREHGVEQLLDVRENPGSRKTGFSAAELRDALPRIGVRYVPLPELGCRREARHAIRRGYAAEPFLAEYRRRLAAHPEALADLVRRVRSAPSLLLCLERDPSRCHRSVLIDELRAAGLRAVEV